MYSKLLMILLAISTSAENSEIHQIYNSYLIKKKKFYSSEHNKKQTPMLLDDYYKAGESALEKIKNIELRNQKIILSAEGNQIALDMELLSPLQILSKDNFSKNSCAEAKHDHNLNYIEKTQDYSNLTNIIGQFCN